MTGTVSELFQNCDSWGAKEWFERLVDAIKRQDECVLAKDEIGFETYKHIAASSAMRLVREHAGEVLSALTASASEPATSVDAPDRIRVAQDVDGFWTCREAVSGSQEYVRADIYDAADRAERSTFEISARLLRERDTWQDLAILALPYLEEAESDPTYKQGAVRELIKKITLAQSAASLASPVPASDPEPVAETIDATRIHEVMEEEGQNGAAAGWLSCSGCHETNEGAETGHYPYSEAFGCYVGHGCNECGGIGVRWERYSATDLEEMLADTPEPVPTPDGAVEALREALEPFAKIADEYADQEDDDFQVWKDFDVLGATLPLKHFRAARAAFETPWQKPGRAAQAQAGEKPDFPADEQSGETSHGALHSKIVRAIMYHVVDGEPGTPEELADEILRLTALSHPADGWRDIESAPTGWGNFFFVRPCGMHHSGKPFLPTIVQFVDGEFYTPENELDPVYFGQNEPEDSPLKSTLEWFPIPQGWITAAPLAAKPEGE